MSHPCNMSYKSFNFPLQEICDYIAIKLCTDYGYDQRKSMIDIRTDKGTFFSNRNPKTAELTLFGYQHGPFITLVERTGHEQTNSLISVIVTNAEGKPILTSKVINARVQIIYGSLRIKNMRLMN